MRNKRTTINISLEAKSKLDTVRSLGQSYDGVIQELVKFCKDKKRSTGPGDKLKGGSTDKK